MASPRRTETITFFRGASSSKKAEEICPPSKNRRKAQSGYSITRGSTAWASPGYRPGSPASFSWLTLKCSAQGMLKPFSRSVSRMSRAPLVQLL